MLPAFAGGRVIIGVCGAPYKCPPAPSEAALLLHDDLSERGIRGDCEISILTPFETPIPPVPDASAALLELFAELGIRFLPGSRIAALEDGRVLLADGSALPFDLFLGVPKHRAPDVVLASPLAEDGYIPVSFANLQTRFPGVYAIGDVASAGVPKAGMFAEGAARVVAETLTRDRGRRRPAAAARRAGLLLHRVRVGPRRPHRHRLPLRPEPHRGVPGPLA